MFGTLRLQNGRVTAEDRAVYKAQFCGACHSLRRFGGRSVSLLTNYDQTLWVTLAVGLQASAASCGVGRSGVGRGGAEGIEQRPCTAAPWRKVGVQAFSAELDAAVAAMDVGVVGAKLRDDIADDGRWRSRSLLWWLGRTENRAREVLGAQGFPVRILDRLPARQAELEARTGAEAQGARAEPTAVARPSAGLSAALFVHAGRLAGRREVLAPLARFGAALGEAIYWLDALEDRAADAARGRFNPLGGDDVVAARARARALACVEVCRVQLAIVESARGMGAHGRLVRGVLDTLASRICRTEGRSGRAPEDAHRARQAGDCDCGACDCGGCDAPGCGGECCAGGCGGASADPEEVGGACCLEVCCCCEICSSRQRNHGDGRGGRASSWWRRKKNSSPY